MFWPQRQEDEMDLKRGMRIYRIFTEVAMTIWWQNTFLSSTRGWELLFLGASDPTTAALSAPGDEPNDVQRSKMPPSTYYWRQTGVDKPIHTHTRTCKHTHACTSPSAEKHQEPGELYQITASAVESLGHTSLTVIMTEPLFDHWCTAVNFLVWTTLQTTFTAWNSHMT